MYKKRGQNEGSIYKRKDGRWVAQVTIQGKHVCKYFHSRSECREWLRAMEDQIRNGLTLAGAQMSLGKYLDQWLSSISGSVQPGTLQQYTQIAYQHVVPRLGHIKLKDLRPDQIQQLYKEKLDAGRSARTVLMTHAVLRRALKQAVRLGIIGRNPVDAVTRPKFHRKEMQTLTDTQVRSLILAAKGTRYEALFWMAVATGLRQGELLGLRWSDLNWKTRRLHVQRQLQREQGTGLVFTQPKSAAGRRVIALGEPTINVLRRHLGLLDQARQQAGARWQDHDLIFPSAQGTPWDHRNVYKYFKRYMEKAGLPHDIRFHDLRHTAATLMLQQGVNPKIVQERLGHADITLTLNTYSHVLPAMQEEAAAKVDELLTPIEVTGEIEGLREESQGYGRPLQTPISKH